VAQEAQQGVENMKTVILNVRCCCQPTKILGRFPVPDHALGCGSFRVATRSFRVATMSQGHSLETHTIEVRLFNNGFLGQEYAVYSDDRPIEFWRSLPSFIEAPPDQGINAPRRPASG
jgi:hypothetical protein